MKAAILANVIVTILVCLVSLPMARGSEPDLQSKWWPTGTASMLQGVEPKDVVKLQIFGLNWPKGVIDERDKEHLARKDYTEGPLTQEENPKDIETLLILIKHAGKWTVPGEGVSYVSLSPDRVLVVQPKEGKPFEILYSSSLDEPFGNLYSKELKEALRALTDGASFSIIHVDKGEVQNVIEVNAPAPHRGSSGSPAVDADMHLVPTGISLHIRVRAAGKVVVDDENPLHYGGAKVFKSSGSGIYIVLLH